MAEAPFDNVDLILVTHAHGDHIDFDMVRQHMTITLGPSSHLLNN